MATNRNYMYRYEIDNNSIVEGFFNVYQAKKGAIVLAMNSGTITLTEKQINELGIDVYSLKDFSYDDFVKYYQDC